MRNKRILDLYWENMPKFRNIRRKRRKFNGNQFAKKEKPAEPEVLSEEEFAEKSQESESDQTDHEQPAQHVDPSSSSFSASASKFGVK